MRKASAPPSVPRRRSGCGTALAYREAARRGGKPQCEQNRSSAACVSQDQCAWTADSECVWRDRLDEALRACAPQQLCVAGVCEVSTIP